MTKSPRRAHAYDKYRLFFEELHSGEAWSELFSPLESKTSYPESRSIIPTVITEYKASKERMGWFSQFVEIYSSGKEKGVIKDIIVHGSFGDFSATEFSDIELTVLLDESVFINNEKKKALSSWIRKKLNKFIVKVDPLQHHGAFFIWEELIHSYSELILPICAYQNCWSINGKPIRFYLDEDIDYFTSESFRRLKITLYKLRDPNIHFFRLGYSYYSVKRYLSNIMLVPAFFYQSKGCVLNKKNSIQRFTKEFSGHFSEVLTLATMIRDEWPKTPKLLKMCRPWFIYKTIPQSKYEFVYLSLFFNLTLNRMIKTKVLPIMKEGVLELVKELDENF